MEENDPKFIKERERLMHTPVNQIKLDGGMSVRDLVDNFTTMSIQVRNLGNAAKIWERKLLDKERPTVFLGLTGPLISDGRSISEGAFPRTS